MMQSYVLKFLPLPKCILPYGQKGEKVAELQFGSRIYGLKVLRRQERRIIHFALFAEQMVKNIYRRSDVIFIQSTAFEKSILKKCNLGDKIVYAPNWADDYFVQPVVDKDKYRAIMPEGFKIMFAGNIGAAQDFDNIIEAANLTRGCQEIKWVIVGEGRYRRIAEEKVAKYGLKDTVFF